MSNITHWEIQEFAWRALCLTRSFFVSSLLDSQVDKVAIVDIFRQVVEGVRYIHSQALLHRDLKVKMSVRDCSF